MGLPAHRPRPPLLTWRDHLVRLDFWLLRGSPGRRSPAAQIEKEARQIERAFRNALCDAYGLEDFFQWVK